MKRTITLVGSLSLVLGAVLAVAGIGALGGPATAARASVGGPVILGGDDLTDHGGSVAGDPVQGWLYIQRAIEDIGPDVTRAGNDGSIAALGSSSNLPPVDGDAGSAIGLVGSKVGRTVAYYDGDVAINQFFVDLAGGTAKPAIIWIAGSRASNDLSGTEPAALTANAPAIAAFVASGGGLMSHGTEYGWLTALLPSASTNSSSSSDDLYFTAEGLAAFPSLTVGDINAGPWHSHFQGDLGGLAVLVRSSDINDNLGQDAPVIIGGSSVTFEAQETPVKLKTHTPTATNTPGPTETPAPTNTAVPTNTAAPPPSPTPVGGRAGTITSPDTGNGPGGGSGGEAMPLAAGASMIALGAVMLMAGRRLRSR